MTILLFANFAGMTIQETLYPPGEYRVDFREPADSSGIQGFKTRNTALHPFRTMPARHSVFRRDTVPLSVLDTEKTSNPYD